ncbi:MAG: hypothetical protein KKE62_04905 [Proteobacteria bacterium]|nr:hypothetical protein [Pseudomonadota bacterium]MBU1388102.1 hypothetical protein [Pseudomonadota bacterium]MBU1542166.1 hypothetical protein [Pseudomonadota bacterium]MBU2430667.1 hypothetical protein [Pseudomonadota bacterium]MBU2481678.1 hypothetical protein [Pseudomonadota bacterium]
MDIKYHIETAWTHSIHNLLPVALLSLVAAAVSIFSLGILAPVVFAGYTHSLFQLLKFNREPRPGDVFSQIHLFFPLLLFWVVILIITFIGFTLLIIPGIIFSVIIGYIGLYIIPVMVDKQYGLIDAIQKSISIVTHSQKADHFIIFIIFTALTIAGSASFLGFLLIQPFATLFLLSAYEHTI